MDHTISSRGRIKVIAALIRKSIERHDPFLVWGDGNDLKDFLYIDDFISGLLKAFETIEDFEQSI